MKVAVIKYNAGNIRSVDYALKRLGVEAVITSDKEVLKAADKVIFPGVGEAETTMLHLKESGMDRFIKELRQPVLGICLGMQIAVIEYARNKAGLPDADSGEFDELCPHKVIDFMPGQSGSIEKGGTLRLGSCPCRIQENTLLARCYGKTQINERHRHRYEFNNAYRELLTQAGLILSGTSLDGRLVEAVELADHPFYIGVQFHPEFKSRPNQPHPLFLGLVRAALGAAQEREAAEGGTET